MSEHPIPRRAIVLLIILTLVWGTNWPLFAFAVQEISVWTFRAIAVTLAGVTLLAVITLVWGTNWALFPLAVREVSVWTFRSVAVFGAGLALLIVARLRGLSLAIPRRHWGPVALATCFYLVLWNIASTYAALMIPSGQAAVLGFTMPLWAALIGWAVLGERIEPFHAVGALLILPGIWLSTRR